MIHEKFLIREADEAGEVHIFPIGKGLKAEPVFTVRSLCQMAESWLDPAPAGDGSPVCCRCARLAGKMGWLHG